MQATSLRLQITQQSARIGIETTRGKLDIQQPPADLSIKQTQAKMIVDQGQGQLNLDNVQAFEALGFKSTPAMLRDLAEQSKRIVIDAIAQIAQDGDRMADLRIKSNPFADIADERRFRGPTPIQDVPPGTYMPVGISYTPHPTKIDWKLGGAEIHVTPHKPIFRYTPANVQVYLDQKNWLKFDVKGQYMNREF